jgi:hypothetical protein
MARRDFPLNIDRRRLLATGAAVATAAIALRADRVDVALADTVQVSALTPEVPPLNVCAATARRLLEIARRNEIRREAKLPLLPIAKELRRMKKQEELEEFERFAAGRRTAVLEEVLRPRREAEGPNWRPSWMEGVRYQSEVHKILRQRFCAAGRGAGLNSGATDATEIASRPQ